MGDRVLSPNSMVGVSFESDMDFDFIDQLLLEGCWLETTDGSEFLQQNPSSPGALLNSSSLWPPAETNIGSFASLQSQVNTQEERQQSGFQVSTSNNKPKWETAPRTQLVGQELAVVAGSESKDYTIEGSEFNRRWWIGPRASPGPALSVMERLIHAIGHIRDSSKDKDALIQIWVPVNKGGRRVLTTNNQPFSLDPNCLNLVKYRDISLNYQFSAEKDSEESEGLPGRVFLGKVPEWSPDVRFFSSDEYPRVNYAQRLDVRGTLALPVFDQGSQTCVGVIEVVTTRQQTTYLPEVESVCKALQAFDLSSVEVHGTEKVKECSPLYQAALHEIFEVLKYACVTHKLPLAQIWIPCIQQGKEGCRHSDENFLKCVSTMDEACYVADPHFQDFQAACSEHHLFKGQGVAGKAFMTNQPCFSPDITIFSKTEYPLSHHARMLGLHAAVAIRFRSIHTGATDFVLEFFLPADYRDPEQQKQMLSSLSNVIQQACRSLRVVSDKELEDESVSSSAELKVPSDGSISGDEMHRIEHAHSERCSPEGSIGTSNVTEVQQSNSVVPLIQRDEPKDPLREKSEKRRTKTEKTITLEVLRQHFSGSLKDAAKSLGVCPTTLKRICRHHGIKRWPSRKIKKVGHSLEKLQRVIDSVQGASGAFQIGSFYSNFPELVSPNKPGTSPSPASPSIHPIPLSRETEDGIFSHHTGSPSTSCSQSSSSSQSCSSGTRENPESNLILRTKSDADLYASCQEEPTPIPRSQSHRSLGETPHCESLPPIPRKLEQISQGEGRRVKIAYGDEKIRFRMQNDWGFQDLLMEIGRRFNIEDITEMNLKYLDDDSEWVLLTCDADWEECLDVCQSSENQTIKLSLQASHSHLGSSFDSSRLPL